VQGDSIPLLRPAKGNKRSALEISSDAADRMAMAEVLATGFSGMPARITLMKIRLRRFIT